MTDCLKLIRPELLAIKQFDVGRPHYENCTLLDANELAWEHCEFHDISLNRYMDSTYDQELIKRLSDYYQVEPTQLLLTRGSCEGIDLLVRAYCRAYQDSILVCPPTFGIFAQCAAYQGANVVAVPLNREADFALDVNAVLNAVTPHTKLVFICSPNNPTGNLIPQKDILTIIEALAGKAMVVVDEAYFEFTNQKSFASFINQYSNLIVLRTLSKAFGLAGLRAGIIIAQQPLMPILMGMMMPFPLSMPVFQALKQVLSPNSIKQMRKNIEIIHEERAHFNEALSACAIVKKIWPSEGNFLFMQLHNAHSALSALNDARILVRHFMGAKGFEDCLRVTVGLRSQNQQFVNLLQTIS